MTFPSGPYPQGFPAQPGFSRQPGFGQQPGYPQPGWPQQLSYPGGPRPTPPPRGPSGATGIIAGILALLGGLVGVALPVLCGLIMWSDREFYGLGAAFGLAGFTFGLALLIGAVLLWRRRMIGRWLIVVGCTVAILAGVVPVIMTIEERDLTSVLVYAVPLGVFPILTLVLTLLPSTAKWVRAKQNAVAPQYYPSFPG
ncbi:hypothetical protein ABQF34_01385 [Mycolicibacterium boenickei]